MSRPEQLSEYLRSIVATFLSRDVDLPDGALATVTRVDVRPRHRHATAWISVLPLARAEETLTLIQERLTALQDTVNTQVKTHPVPRMSVRLDQGPARSAHIEQLLRTIHE
jgi:ribosome-binding factor A